MCQLVGVESFLQSPFDFWTLCFDHLLYCSSSDWHLKTPSSSPSVVQLSGEEQLTPLLAKMLKQEPMQKYIVIIDNNFNDLTEILLASFQIFSQDNFYFSKDIEYTVIHMNQSSSVYSLVQLVESCKLSSELSIISCKHFLSSSFCLFLEHLTFFKRDRIV